MTVPSRTCTHRCAGMAGWVWGRPRGRGELGTTLGSYSIVAARSLSTRLAYSTWFAPTHPPLAPGATGSPRRLWGWHGSGRRSRCAPRGCVSATCAAAVRGPAVPLHHAERALRPVPSGLPGPPISHASHASLIPCPLTCPPHVLQPSCRCGCCSATCWSWRSCARPPGCPWHPPERSEGPQPARGTACTWPTAAARASERRAGEQQSVESSTTNSFTLLLRLFRALHKAQL